MVEKSKDKTIYKKDFMIKYLHMDCEMGGIDVKYSLLTAYFLITDDKFNILDGLSLFLKPDDDVYIISGQGMSVNKIDIIQHDKIATSYKEAKTLLYKFLSKSSDNGKVKLTPVGHAVKNDINHVIDKLISIGSWEQHCTYHYIDTSVVLQYLRACGKIPLHIDGSVAGLVEYFNINPIPTLKVNWHSAEFDTLMTMLVYQKMIELGKS
jgi:oligoribonuclease (3'-5' exoribonuclease)